MQSLSSNHYPYMLLYYIYFSYCCWRTLLFQWYWRRQVKARPGWRILLSWCPSQYSGQLEAACLSALLLNPTMSYLHAPYIWPHQGHICHTSDLVNVICTTHLTFSRSYVTHIWPCQGHIRHTFDLVKVIYATYLTLSRSYVPHTWLSQGHYMCHIYDHVKVTCQTSDLVKVICATHQTF